MVRAGLRACDAAELTRHGLETLAAAPTRGGTSALDRPGYVCIAAGKAAVAMAKAASGALRDRLRGGLIVAPTAEPFGSFEAIAGGHPVPSEGSERAGRRALEIAESLKPDEALLVLLSGGASALMAVPAEGVSLDDKRQATSQLLRAGADIHALNTVRKHLSAIKGGWLATRSAGPVRTFVISDVIGDDPSVIASGPTVPDQSTFGDARQLLDRFGGPAAFPAAVVSRLDRGARGELPETPKPAYPRLVRSDLRIIGSRRDAMAGVAGRAIGLGYEVLRLDDAVVGEARTAAVSHLRAVLAVASDRPRPLCVISTGETTVTVTGAGRGGRNQEFALAAAESLAHVGGRAVLASIGTDGVDGPTEAAGAIVDSTTLARAGAAGLAPERFLADNNAFAFFDALGDLINIGPTGTNVGDLQIILLA
jgi:glycerate 2-kinase